MLPATHKQPQKASRIKNLECTIRHGPCAQGFASKTLLLCDFRDYSSTSNNQILRAAFVVFQYTCASKDAACIYRQIIRGPLRSSFLAACPFLLGLCGLLWCLYGPCVSFVRMTTQVVALSSVVSSVGGRGINACFAAANGGYRGDVSCNAIYTAATGSCDRP